MQTIILTRLGQLLDVRLAAFGGQTGAHTELDVIEILGLMGKLDESLGVQGQIVRGPLLVFRWLCGQPGGQCGVVLDGALVVFVGKDAGHGRVRLQQVRIVLIIVVVLGVSR